MNCQELIDYLIHEQSRGADLTQIPVMYMDIVNDKQIAYQTITNDIKIVNVNRCNRDESPIMTTQFLDALLIGYIREIDVND